MPARMSFALPNTTIPVSGPVGINVSLDFTGGDNVTGDLGLEQMQGVIDYVQSIWIDNFSNTKTLTIIFSGTQQRLTIAAGKQALLPVIAATGRFSWAATSVGSGIVVPVIFMNQIQQPFVF